MVDRSNLLASFAIVCGVVSLASAPSGASVLTPPAQPVMKLTADAGFVDDVVAYDNQRVAYVVADSATKSELHVVQLGCERCLEEKQEIVVDLSSVTLRPTALRLLGQRAFVIGAAEDGRQVAALVELAQRAAKTTYALGPAAHIALVQRDGATRVAVHRTSATRSGTRHEVDLFALDTGKRIAAGKALELDGDYNKALDLHVNHWADGWTRVVGLKGGVWTKKSNMRGPDTEATYDLIGGTFVENKVVDDVIAQRKRFHVHADAGGQLEFLRTSWDHSAIQVWARGQSRSIELDQPFQDYDVSSLQGVVNADGSAWIALQIDPVNPAAVARKKADAEYLDVFRVGAGQTTAVRMARFPARNQRFKFGVFDGYMWLLERSSSFDRGGRSITIYKLP